MSGEAKEEVSAVVCCVTFLVSGSAHNVASIRNALDTSSPHPFLASLTPFPVTGLNDPCSRQPSLTPDTKSISSSVSYSKERWDSSCQLHLEFSLPLQTVNCTDTRVESVLFTTVPPALITV